MIICLCKNISEKEIVKVVSSGECGSLKQLSCKLGVARQCGKCACIAKELVENTHFNLTYAHPTKM